MTDPERLRGLSLIVLLALFLPMSGKAAQEPPDLQLFFQTTSSDEKEAEAALEAIAENWQDGYTPLLIDIARFLPSPRRRTTASNNPYADRDPSPGSDPDAEVLGTFPTGGSSPSRPPPLSPRAKARARITKFLEQQTGEKFGDDLSKWRKWMWNRPYETHPDYALFKSVLYGEIDQRMVEFFPPDGKSLIRLDEIDWGGVPVNGIPPLDHPQHVAATDADYLDDDHIVFGIALNGEVRAYPKRILAWHEMARDRIGGVELAIVYCTLCGTVIPYGAEVGGEHRTLGTSGLLYRSNKLMFDEESKSLWSTVEGRPVVGPLAGEDLELRIYPVVTTEWKEWRLLHPDTTVLSIDTGHERDYSEGEAYKDYFRNDRLMFGVPKQDKRLKNKDEVFAVLLRPKGEGPDAERKALALSAKYLKKHRLHQMTFAGHNLVILTSKKGANRVYDAAGHRFDRQTKEGDVIDAKGGRWQLTEDALVSSDATLDPLPRIAARRAFWFGWHAQFPDTMLRSLGKAVEH